MKRIVSILLCAIFLIGTTTIVMAAANFRDIGPNQAWARQAIDAVSTAGIMAGDLQGNFNPADPVSKFDAVRIFARMSGFNPDALTPQETAYHNAVFEARRGAIDAVSGQFNSWNNAFDREIAFLLYSGVLIPSDLQNFIIMHDGQERLRALSREEAAVFMVRLMGRTQEALRTIGVQTFGDDHLIAPGARPHIYFLRHLDIMIGDGSGNVNPRGIATRAHMAILAYDVLNEMQSPVLGHTPPPATGNIESIAGIIVSTYPSFRSIMIRTEDNAVNRILPVTQAAIITINGINSSFGDLAEGMEFAATLTSGEIVSISVTAVLTGQHDPSPTPPPQEAEPVTPALERQVLDGTVARVDAAASTIGIETRMLNPRGEIITNVQDYVVPASAVITRSGDSTNLASIIVGDLVVAHVYGREARSLELEERVRQVSGTLVEKNFAANAIFPMLVVQDANGRNHSFETTENTVVYRAGMGNIRPRAIRIGDNINIVAELGRVTQVSAVGQRSEVDVFIRDILISYREQSHLVVSEQLYGTPASLHLIVDGMFDVYALTVGSRVRLSLDSQEVLGVHLLGIQTAGTFTGNVIDITHNQITVRDANFTTRTFSYDSLSIFFNSVTGRPIHVGEIFPGMRVQVIADPTNAGRVLTVTVLTD